MWPCWQPLSFTVVLFRFQFPPPPLSLIISDLISNMEHFLITYLSPTVSFLCNAFECESIRQSPWWSHLFKDKGLVTTLCHNCLLFTIFNFSIKFHHHTKLLLLWFFSAPSPPPNTTPFFFLLIFMMWGGVSRRGFVLTNSYVSKLWLYSLWYAGSWIQFEKMWQWWF